jgi:amino acid transporter
LPIASLAALLGVTDLANVSALCMLFTYTFICAALLKYRIRGKHDFYEVEKQEPGSVWRIYCVHIFVIISLFSVIAWVNKWNLFSQIVINALLVGSIYHIYQNI